MVSVIHQKLAPIVSAQDGPAFKTINEMGASPIILICEHASHRIPISLGDLGLNEQQRQSHIAWDPGASLLARALSAQLDATLIEARFSRLVYDCNRPPEAISAMPHDTEVCHVAGNANIDAAERWARTQEIYIPFHAQIAHQIAHKRASGLVPTLVSIHSFTPIFHGQTRDVEIGFLHGKQAELAHDLCTYAQNFRAYDVRLNAPYAPEDGVLHLMEKHQDDTGLKQVMIEVRNDLLAQQNDFDKICALLAQGLQEAVHSTDSLQSRTLSGTI